MRFVRRSLTAAGPGGGRTRAKLICKNSERPPRVSRIPLGRVVLTNEYTWRVPIISAFFGIVIRMFYKEHEPPHFHAEHSRQQAKFTFDGELLAGEIRSRKARQRIREWALRHRAELDVNWERMKAGQPLESIAPLQESTS